MNLQLIDNWQAKDLECICCGTHKSVKYYVKIWDGSKRTVCNRCAIRDLEHPVVSIWRYTIEESHTGGLVLATTIEEAQRKLQSKYDKGTFIIWRMLDDDYYDFKNPDVFECYGL